MNRKIAILSAVVCVGCFSAIGVQALPVCENLVKSYKQIRVRNKVSPLTAARWAAWGKTHPDFKPHARPKYKLATREVVEKVGFACAAMPHIPHDEIALLPAPPLTDFLPTLPDGPATSLTGVTPGVSEVATENAPVLPFVPPYSSVGAPLLPSPVPEPTEFVLMMTGLAAVLTLKYRRTILRG